MLGRDLQVKSASTPEHVAEVEALVNEKLAEASESVNGGDSQVVVILALMHLAEAYLGAKQELDKERSAFGARVAGLIGRLDGRAV